MTHKEASFPACQSPNTYWAQHCLKYPEMGIHCPYKDGDCSLWIILYFLDYSSVTAFWWTKTCNVDLMPFLFFNHTVIALLWCLSYTVRCHMLTSDQLYFQCHVFIVSSEKYVSNICQRSAFMFVSLLHVYLSLNRMKEYCCLNLIRVDFNISAEGIKYCITHIISIKKSCTLKWNL